MTKPLPSPLDANFWHPDNSALCQFTKDWELNANWHALRECYDLCVLHRDNLHEAMGGDEQKLGRVLIGAAIWKARNSM